MKKAKIFTALFISALMMFLLQTTAFAAGNTITIENAQAGQTYKVYRMFDLSINEDKTAYSYTINENWNTFFSGETGSKYISVTNGYVTKIKDSKGNEIVFDADTPDQAADLAAAAAAAAESITASGSVTVADGADTAVFSSLPDGYYLVVSTNGTVAMIDTLQSESLTITEKNSSPAIEKTVKEDSNSFGETNDAQIGDTIDFQIKITAKKGAKNYVVHDKMDAGLTFNNDIAIKDKNDNTITDYTIAKDNLTDGCTFEITFDQDYLDTITESTDLIITYSATLNENAVTDANGNGNEATLKWGNNNSTTSDTTKTKTYKFNVLKYDGNDSSKKVLAGATFELRKNNTVVKLYPLNTTGTAYRVATQSEIAASPSNAVDNFTTVADSQITIIGVDNDSDYTLVETNAPDGYNKLNDPIAVTVGTSNAYVAEIANKTGTELPITGGSGTAILISVGVLIFMSTILVLVAKKRLYNEENAE